MAFNKQKLTLNQNFMKRHQIIAMLLLTFFFVSCKKEKSDSDKGYVYYEVGFKSTNADWRDTAFVVRTNNLQLIQKADVQLELPLSERKIVTGGLVSGSSGYNKNAAHEFKWHFKEDDWNLVDVTVEIYDGKPFTDIDSNLSYWLDTVKRFGSWGSYIRKKLPAKP